jgi:hypothetical protein
MQLLRSLHFLVWLLKSSYFYRINLVNLDFLKMKKINFKFFAFCLFILLASSFLLTGCGKQIADEEIEEKDVVAKEEVGEERVEIPVGDFSKFSNENQEIGSVGNDVYEIVLFEEKEMEGFHRFTFEVEGSDNLVNVLASYKPELGTVRLLFKEIEEDNSGLGYQKSYDINKEGIVKVFHNISPNSNEEVYDIGIAKSTVFFLHSEKLEDGKWRINLDVRYPGEFEIEIDSGSDEFGDEEQSIEGAKASDGGRITNYSYGVEENAFRFIWTVRGSESNPIPEVRARYNEEGELAVIFPDLDSDYIGRDSNESELIGNVESVSWNRVGNETIYRFVLTEKRDFRLSSSLSPNQVILEIEL